MLAVPTRESIASQWTRTPAISRKTSTHPGFRPDIEGLRGVAILLVVAYHSGIACATGGYVGVDVFFVLSGYLITGLLLNEVTSTGRIDYLRFYARRARRLLPAAVSVLVITLLAGWVILSPTEQRDLTRSVMAAASYMSNGLFAARATNYLAGDLRGDPVLHTWSLGVEEQFYFVWPLLIAISVRGRRAAGVIIARSRLMRVVWLVVVASFILSISLTRFAQAWAFFGSPARVWEFGVGALAVMKPWPALHKRQNLARMVGYLGFAAILVSAVRFDTNTSFPGFAAALPVIGTAAILISGGIATGGISRLLSVAVIQWFGRISYSWYLWHWPVLAFAWIVDPTLGLAGRLACVAFALMLATITHAIVETPVRTNRFLGPRPRLSVAGAAALTVGMIAFAFGVRLAAAHEASAPLQITFTRARLDIPAIEKDGCRLGYLEVIPPNCTFGDTNADTTVVLFGDSHAGHWWPALSRIAQGRRWRIVTFVKAECPTMSVQLRSAKLGRAYTECDHWRAAAIGKILALRPQIVLLSNSSYYIARADSTPDPWQISASAWELGTRETVSQFAKVGIRTTILRDVLLPGFNVPVCLSRKVWSPLWRGSSCTFPLNGSINNAAVRAEVDGIAGIPRATTVDMNDLICNASPCGGERNGIVLFSDSNHMTATFSASLAGALAARLDRVMD